MRYLSNMDWDYLADELDAPHAIRPLFQGTSVYYRHMAVVIWPSTPSSFCDANWYTTSSGRRLCHVHRRVFFLLLSNTSFTRSLLRALVSFNYVSHTGN